MIHEIRDGEKLLAIVIPHDFDEPGLTFFTPDTFSQQLAYMNHKKTTKIAPHIHNAVSREVVYTQEVLIIRSGKVRVDFYDDQKKYVKSCVLVSGDVVLLAAGGHGFEMIEDAQIIEVKQGPYIGEKDKVRFDAVNDENVILEEIR